MSVTVITVSAGCSISLPFDAPALTLKWSAISYFQIQIVLRFAVMASCCTTQLFRRMICMAMHWYGCTVGVFSALSAAQYMAGRCHPGLLPGMQLSSRKAISPPFEVISHLISLITLCNYDSIDASTIIIPGSTNIEVTFNRCIIKLNDARQCYKPHLFDLTVRIWGTRV